MAKSSSNWHTIACATKAYFEQIALISPSQIPSGWRRSGGLGGAYRQLDRLLQPAIDCRQVLFIDLAGGLFQAQVV